jgi:hypothetical protein
MWKQLGTLNQAKQPQQAAKALLYIGHLCSTAIHSIEICLVREPRMEECVQVVLVAVTRFARLQAKVNEKAVVALDQWS